MEEDLTAVVWREVLLGIFSTMGRLAHLANCREARSGEYRHDNLAKCLGAEKAARAIRFVHSLVWMDWLHGSLTQQRADLLMYLRAASEHIEKMPFIWHDIEPYRAFIPDTAVKAERDLFIKNLPAPAYHALSSTRLKSS